MQSKWWVPDSLNLKKFAIGVVGDNWKDERNKLYLLKSKKGTRPREAVEADVPDGVDPEQWKNYIAWRMGELGRARERRGQQARAQQEVGHATGSVPLIVRYDEMVYNYPLLFLYLISYVIIILIIV